MDNFDVIFESENILYIQLSESLINEYLELVNNVEIQKMLHDDIKVYSYEDELNWVRKKTKNNSPIFSMIEKQTNKYIGNIEVIVDGDVGELAIAITSDMQNKKYGSEAIKRIIDYSLKNLKLRKLHLKVFKRMTEQFMYIKNLDS